MDKGVYRFLKWTAILLTIAWVGWSIYDSMISPRKPGDLAYLAANNLFEDGEYQRAQGCNASLRVRSMKRKSPAK